MLISERFGGGVERVGIVISEARPVLDAVRGTQVGVLEDGRHSLGHTRGRHAGIEDSSDCLAPSLAGDQSPPDVGVLGVGAHLWKLEPAADIRDGVPEEEHAPGALVGVHQLALPGDHEGRRDFRLHPLPADIVRAAGNNLLSARHAHHHSHRRRVRQRERRH